MVILKNVSKRSDVINLRQLQYFRKVIEAGNITAAAEALNLAQPALGAQIRQLEKELGTELLVRHSRGVSSTEAGKLLYRHACQITDAVEQARHDVLALRSSKTIQLRLGVCPSMIQVLGTNLLIDARSALPGVLISLEEERSPVLLSALEAGQLDFVFAYDVKDTVDLERRALLEEDFLLVNAPARASGSGEIGFAEALQCELAIGGERSPIRNAIEAEARRLGMSVKIAFEVHSVLSMKAIVAGGLAATIMPYSLVSREVEDGTLVCRRIARPQITRTLFMAWPRANRPVLDYPLVLGHLDKLVRSYTEAIIPFGRSLG